MSQAAHVQDLGPSRAVPGGRARIVLVMEDDPDVRELLRRALLRQGYVMEATADVRQGMRLLARRFSDVALVLSDLEMPGLTGEIFVTDVMHAYPRLPIAVLCSTLPASIMARSPQVQAWLPKPFGLPSLFGMLDRLRPQ